METKTSLEIVQTPSPLEGKDEHKLEYIKNMIALVREDIKHIMLYITLSLGVVILILTQVTIQVIRPLPLWGRLLAFAGIILQGAASFCFFLFIRKLHIIQMRMTRCIVSLDVIRTRELWAGDAGVWQLNKLRYTLGLIFMGSGLTCLCTVLFYLLVFASLPVQ
ncbi:MAG TPA: hypothetical protein VGB98_20785 [Pyrinomonadaceae bacterium]